MAHSLDAGLEVTLEVRGTMDGLALAGLITRLPNKGALFAVNATGHRKPITSTYNSFDVGAPIVSQYLSRVLRVSSFYAIPPPYAGYHALGILGAPDCARSPTANTACQSDLPWVSDPTLYPSVGTHVSYNGHIGYVRATDPASATVQLEMLQYYKWSPGFQRRLQQQQAQAASQAGGAWVPCFMDPTDLTLQYPDGCLDDAAGGGLNGAHGRPARLSVARTAIAPFNSAVWSPSTMSGDLWAASHVGGGMFGPQYEWQHSNQVRARGMCAFTVPEPCAHRHVTIMCAPLCPVRARRTTRGTSRRECRTRNSLRWASTSPSTW